MYSPERGSLLRREGLYPHDYDHTSRSAYSKEAARESRNAQGPPTHRVDYASVVGWVCVSMATVIENS